MKKCSPQYTPMNLLDRVGSTPIIKLENLYPGQKINIYAKLECNNPSGTIKDRFARWLVREALKKKEFNTRFLGVTSGSFGVSLSWFACYSGMKASIILPNNVTTSMAEKIKLMGGDLIFSDGGLENSILCAESVSKDLNAYYCRQFSNTDHVELHAVETAMEIKRQLTSVDNFVMSAGSDATLMGLYNGLPHKWRTNYYCAYTYSNKNPSALRLIDPGCLKGELYVETDMVLDVQKVLIRKFGIPSGFVGAMNIAASVELARQLNSGNILTMITDSI